MALAACNDGASTTENGSDPVHPIIGTWTWVRTESGESVKIPFNPTTAGYTQTYQFDFDSTYTFARTPDSGRVSKTGPFVVTPKFDAITQDTETFVAFMPSKSSFGLVVLTRLQFHGLDTMLLGEGATDGLVEFYVRTP